MTYPTFTNGTPLPATDLNAIGLWKVKSQTVGTGVSSVTVTGAFSADYDNYRIVISGGSMSTGTNLMLKLGTTATAGYFGTFIYTASFAGAPAVQSAGDNNAAQFSFAGGGGTDSVGAVFDLTGPNLAKTTRIAATGIHYSTVCGAYNGVDTAITQHTAFVLTPSGGTITGSTITVYGYRK